jgi:hypothetical protein
MHMFRGTLLADRFPYLISIIEIALNIAHIHVAETLCFKINRYGHMDRRNVLLVNKYLYCEIYSEYMMVIPK